jgi:hypothetical protein
METFSITLLAAKLTILLALLFNCIHSLGLGEDEL